MLQIHELYASRLWLSQSLQENRAEESSTYTPHSHEHNPNHDGHPNYQDTVYPAVHVRYEQLQELSFLLQKFHHDVHFHD